MKIILAAALLMTGPVLAGCSSTSGESARRAEAWSRCSTAPNPEIRDRCIETEIALLEAKEQKDADSRAAYEKEAEQRQAVLEAQGVPEDKAKQVIDHGLKLPD